MFASSRSEHETIWATMALPRDPYLSFEIQHFIVVTGQELRSTIICPVSPLCVINRR